MKNISFSPKSSKINNRIFLSTALQDQTVTVKVMFQSTCSTLTMSPKKAPHFIDAFIFWKKNLLNKGYNSTFGFGKHCRKRGDSVVVSNIQRWRRMFWKKSKQQKQCHVYAQAADRTGMLNTWHFKNGRNWPRNRIWTQMNRSLALLWKSCTWHFYLALLFQ